MKNKDFVDTDLGEQIISDLKHSGWKLSSAYSIFAFDKGIDYDYVWLRKNKQMLYFEWTNWFGWEIQGNDAIIDQICHDYDLTEAIVVTMSAEEVANFHATKLTQLGWQFKAFFRRFL